MAQAQGQVQGIVLNQASQGGIIDDIDVEIIDASFCEWDYNGNIDHNILALGVQYQDDTGKSYDQYYSAGELTYFVPSDDGGMAVPVADKNMLTDTCNAWKLLASLMECGGEPMVALLGRGNVKELVGMKVHVKQFAQPKRQGLIRGGKNADREPTVLLVNSILAWPGQAAPAPVKKAGIGGAGKPVTGRPTTRTGTPALGAVGKAAPATQTAKGKANGQAGPSTISGAGAGEDDKALAAEAVSAILVESGGSVTKKDLAKLAFQKAGEMVTGGKLDAKNKTKIVQLIFQDAFLHELAQAGVIAFDGATVSFAG
jgi:hypothetical protein